MKMVSQSSQLKNYLVAWIILMVIGIILFILPMAFDVQPVKTGIALFVIGVLLAGLGLGMSINYSVKIIKQELNKPKSLPIVEWTFSREEWREFCIQNLKYKIKLYLKIFFVISVVIIICIIISYFSKYERIYDIVDFILYDLIVGFIIILFYPFLEFITLKLSKSEVRVFESSVIVGGAHYNWDVPNGKLIEVKMLNENPPVIGLNYSIPNKRTLLINMKLSGFAVRIPVPIYELNKGQEIVEMFRQKINS